MSIDEAERDRRSQFRAKWARARAQAAARKPEAPSPTVDRLLTRRQIASRAQRAASEALAELYRRQREERPDE